MDNFLLLPVMVMFILLAVFLIFYFQAQQNFKEISDKLEAMQLPSSNARSTESFKRELALQHDVLVVLEANISINKRESLTEDELQAFDVARARINACISGLKANGDWLGLPFDYEWAEILDRLPNVLLLYRKAEAEKKALAMEAAESNDSP
jgi:Flp pilus assembly protein TadB